MLLLPPPQFEQSVPVPRFDPPAIVAPAPRSVIEAAECWPKITKTAGIWSVRFRDGHEHTFEGADWTEMTVRQFAELHRKNNPPADAPKAVLNGYPLRGGYWTGCPNWRHMTQSVHAGRFPVDWLQSLSWDELQSLHSDDHEGRVKWDYVPKR